MNKRIPEMYYFKKWKAYKRGRISHSEKDS